MKKILLTLLALVSIVSALSGCEGGSNTAKASDNNPTVYIFIGDYEHEFYVLRDDQWYTNDSGYNLELPNSEEITGYFKMIETKKDRVEYYRNLYRGE